MQEVTQLPQTPSKKASPVLYAAAIASVIVIAGLIVFLYSSKGIFVQVTEQDVGMKQTNQQVEQVLDQRKAATSCLLDAVENINEYAQSNPNATQDELSALSADLQKECDAKFPQFAPSGEPQ